MALSVDALKLAGALNRNDSWISLKRITTLCRDAFDKNRTPTDIADELVAYGFLARRGNHWVRTDMEYTQEMYRQLRALAKEHRIRADRNRQLNIVPDVDPGIAYWFGYPTHPVYATGRVHYLEDDEP